MLSLFGKKKEEPKPDTAAVLGILHDQIVLLEKQNAFLEKQIQEDVIYAKKNAAKNKKGAMARLKMKKTREATVEKNLAKIQTLEEQKMNIQSTKMNVDVYKAMKTAASHQTKLQSGVTVDQVDELRDELADQKMLADELDNALAAPSDMGVDQDELEAELDALMEEDVDAQLMGLDSVPAVPTKVPASASKPGLTKKQQEDAEFAALEAELAM